MGVFDWATAMNTAFISIDTKKANRLSKQQVELAKAQAVREIEQQTRQADREDVELRCRLHTDVPFRGWYEQDQAAERQAMVDAAAHRAHEAQLEEQRRRDRGITFWWVVGLVFVPWIVAFLPHTRRRLAGSWVYWLVIAWAALLIIRWVVLSIQNSS